MADIPRVPVATDCAVFTILDNEFKILLIKRKNKPFKGMFALPGGFLEPKDKSLNDCAARELEEETGVKNIFLKMLLAFGDIGRDPRDRVVAISYLALINAKDVKLNETELSEEARWVSVNQIGKMAFDHRKIIDEALWKLRREINRSTIIFQLLNERFTLTEMQKAYEIILDKPLDKRNFRKWVKQHNILLETNETKMEGVHRPARLYECKQNKYERFG